MTATATAAVCAACGSEELSAVETIETQTLADAWQREDQVVGVPDHGDERARQMLSTLPDRIHFNRCSRCGLEMATPAIVWSSSTYPADQSYPIRWEFERALDDLGPEPLDVLEIGCGTGHFLSMAAARGHRAVGIDFSATAVAAARERGVRAYHGGFDELAAHVGAAARFDAVAFFHVIEHLPDPDGFFRTLASWMRPIARVCLSCPGPRRFTRLIREQQAGRSDFWDYPPQHVLRWTLPALDALVTRHGWRVVTAMEEPFSWIAAASQIGIARAMYRGDAEHPLGRRLSVATGWLRLLAASEHRSGASIYVCARRGGEPPA